MPESPLAAHPESPAAIQDWIAAERSGAPFLLYRDPEARHDVFPLAGRQHATLGRRPGCDVSLPWDAKVSRLHASVERIGDTWAVVDDGLSHNGTYLNNERVAGRKRLADADTIKLGDTLVVFCDPAAGSQSEPTVTSIGPRLARRLTPAQRRLLLALCRPCRSGDFVAPATNPQIAEELHLTIDSVKSGLQALFELFGIENLPQNQKRAQLAVDALQTGVVSRREL